MRLKFKQAATDDVDPRLASHDISCLIHQLAANWVVLNITNQYMLGV